MKLDKCGICQFLPNKKPIFETKYWEINIAPDQGYLGRCYVTLKEHKGDLAELTKEEWLDYAEIVKKLEGAIRLAFGAIVFNWGCLMNNAFQVSSATPHIHWHLRPRYDQTVHFDGTDFVDPLFGFHYDRAQTKKVSNETLSNLQSKIQENLS
ncbi:MAG: HIT family protein [Candidatus Saccharibacteria bacterium]